MKKLLLVVAFLSLTGCASIKDWIPVKWDSNQSHSITTIQQTTRNFDCKGDVAAQSKVLASHIEWFEIYSKNKPTRDVIVPAEKPPSLFLATTLPITLDGVASTLHVLSTPPSKSEPTIYVPFRKKLVVDDLTVTSIVPLNGTPFINLAVENWSAL